MWLSGYRTQKSAFKIASAILEKTKSLTNRNGTKKYRKAVVIQLFIYSFQETLFIDDPWDIFLAQ
jgi:hypothetical protein